jgi:dCMP deaminase
MCRRQIINAGIETVITRIGRDSYEIVPVSRWIENDDTLGAEA